MCMCVYVSVRQVSQVVGLRDRVCILVYISGPPPAVWYFYPRTKCCHQAVWANLGIAVSSEVGICSRCVGRAAYLALSPKFDNSSLLARPSEHFALPAFILLCYVCLAGNTLGAIAGVAGPIAVASFTDEWNGIWGWRAVFFLTGAMCAGWLSPHGDNIAITYNAIS